MASSGLLCRGQRVGAYLAIGSELETGPLLDRSAGLGIQLCLPVIAHPERPLLFRSWAPGEPLVPAPFGLSEPAPDALEVIPDLMIVPLLAFARDGRRLGYGGGYYDRTLEVLRAGHGVVAVGFAHAGQEMPDLPAGPLDARLDYIATEGGLIRCGPESMGRATDVSRRTSS